MFILNRFFDVLYKLEEAIENQEFKKRFNIFLNNAKQVHELHKELSAKLKLSADVFESCTKGAEYMCQAEHIGDVIVSKKHNFFMYAPFITQCKNMTELIQKMKNKEGVKDEIAKLENIMQEMNRKENRTDYRTEIEHLLMMPFQHILRY